MTYAIQRWTVTGAPVLLALHALHLLRHMRDRFTHPGTFVNALLYPGRWFHSGWPLAVLALAILGSWFLRRRPSPEAGRLHFERARSMAFPAVLLAAGWGFAALMSLSQGVGMLSTPVIGAHALVMALLSLPVVVLIASRRLRLRFAPAIPALALLLTLWMMAVTHSFTATRYWT